jgi:large subunit ribosomal protein L13
MKTYIPKLDEISRDWYTVDVADQVLGRVATRIARVLRGKHKTMFTPHMDVGDFVVVLNAAQVRLTGKKETQKYYFHYTGYPGGGRSITVEKMREKRPEEIILHAVRGMLPKNRLGRRLMTKLKVYPGAEHPHAAQSPKPLNLS